MRLLSCPLCLHPHHSQPPTGSPAVLPGDADKEATMAVVFWAMLYVCLGLTFGCMTPKNDADDLPPAASRRGQFTARLREQGRRGVDEDGPRDARRRPAAGQTFDPLRDLMESPRAQSIERSLGVDN